MKNYSVTFEFEYWTHAETEDEATAISIKKLINDLMNYDASSIAEIKVKEISEES